MQGTTRCCECYSSQNVKRQSDEDVHSLYSDRDITVPRRSERKKTTHSDQEFTVSTISVSTGRPLGHFKTSTAAAQPVPGTMCNKPRRGASRRFGQCRATHAAHLHSPKPITPTCTYLPTTCHYVGSPASWEALSDHGSTTVVSLLLLLQFEDRGTARTKEPRRPRPSPAENKPRKERTHRRHASHTFRRSKPRHACVAPPLLLLLLAAASLPGARSTKVTGIKQHLCQAPGVC
jgi:hypothetical protein